MQRRRQAPGVDVKSNRRRHPQTRSLRAPGWLDKPGALRSLDVCLDSTGPFIDVILVPERLALARLTRSLQPPAGPAAGARDGGHGRAARRRRRADRRGAGSGRHSRRRRAADLLDRLEVDPGLLVVELRLQLRIACDGEVALRLDHVEVRRHADLEPLLLGVEALLGQLAREPRRLDALPVLIELHRGLPDLAHDLQLGAAQALDGLLALEARARVV